MLNFQKLKIKNFMSISEAEFDLSGDDGFILINAENRRKEDNATSNGSGKSSLFDALCWALTGETIRGNKDVYNRFNKNEKALCEVRVYFEFKGSKWRVLRCQDKNGRKQLGINKDGENLPAKGLIDAEAQLERHLPELTMKFLGSTVILGQGLPQRFTNNSPAGRKAILEELLNADYMIEHVKEKIEKRGEILSKELREKEDEQIRNESSLELSKRQLNNAKEKYESLQKIDLDRKKQRMQELEEKGSVLTVKIKELESQQTLLENERLEIYTKRNSERDLIAAERDKKKSDLQNELIVLEKEASSRREEETRLAALRKIECCSVESDLQKEIKHFTSMISGNICPTCGQSLQKYTEQEISEMRRNIEEKKAALLDVQNEITNIATFIKEKMLEIEKDLTNEQNKVQLEISNLEIEYSEKTLKCLSKFDKKISDISKKLEDVKDDIGGKSAVRQNYRDEYITYRQEIKQYEENIKITKEQINMHINNISLFTSSLESLGLSVDKLKEHIKVNTSMKSFASRDFRGILLESIVEEFDCILRGYAKNVYGSPLTRFYQEGNKIGISFDDKEYEALSGGEKQKLDVLIQLSLRDLIIKTSGIQANFVVFDEVFDGLDFAGCEAILQVLVDLGIKCYVITHRKELQIPYDSVILVVKEEDGNAHLEYTI